MKKPRSAIRADTASLPNPDALVLAVLPQIPFDGWTPAAVDAGARQLGLKPGEAGLLLPQGIHDVIDRFGAMADEAMEQAIDRKPGFIRLRTRDKIAFMVQARLEFCAPYREAYRRLMVWYGLPLNIPVGIKRLYRTVDLIWRAAGDTATDFNFYTKRLLLAGVVKATTLFWLNDESEGAKASWQFLDRRIGEVLKLGKSISLLKEFRPGELVEMAVKTFKKV